MARIELQMAGFRLTTAEIIYHLPDAPSLLQSFIWQEYDAQPEYPKLHKFLDFWNLNLDGKVHSVYVASAEKISAGSWRQVSSQFQLH